MPGTYTRLLVHVIFSTKRREPLITPDLHPRLHAYLGGIVRTEKGIAHAVGGTTDHVHLLIGLRPDRSAADIVRAAKGRSSAWVHEKFPRLRSFYWQDGYGAFTVSPSQFEAVNRYILNQEQHHRRRTFEEEYVRLLEASGVEYDKRYVLD